jgi:DNA-binding PadR family transcriptional regulator
MIESKKINFTKKILNFNLNAAGFILFYLKEVGYITFDAFLPSNYSNAKFWREIFGLDSKKEIWKKNTIKTNLYRLKKQKLIDYNSNKKVYFITNKGKEFTTYIKDRYFILKKPWDKEIRIVIFDIPEEKRGYRDWFRQELYLLEFKLLQKSVFIGKYPLPQSLIKEIDNHNLTPYVFIFTVKEIFQKEKILKLFEK